MRPTALALIDGEHYPPVVVEGLARAGEEFAFVAALFLGGAEKIETGELAATAGTVYGLPVVFDSDRVRGLERALSEYRPEVVVDLSDEPVLGYIERFQLISHSLARNVTYVGSDFRFNPPAGPRLRTCPSVSIIGTAKRVGKTALSGYVARTLQASLQEAGRGEATRGDPDDGSPGVVIVAMGRGGPEAPEVIDGRGAGLEAADLLRWSRQGRHAASDHFEDAVLSRLLTVGCRRCGGGLAGAPFVSNVVEGAALAESLGPELLIFEGSGAAVPPVCTDARLLVAGAHQPVDHVAGYLGTYRLLTSDALVLTMAEEPLATRERVEAITEAAIQTSLDPEMVVPVIFRPHPARPVQGRRVAYFCTAPPVMQAPLRRYLEERYECRVELVSSHLSDRAALRRDLERPELAHVDTYMSEIKAAAIDVVAAAAEERGRELVFVDNLPHEVPPAREGDLARLVEVVGVMARDRFVERTG